MVRMIRFFCLLLLAGTTGLPAQTWELVWSDEFNGTAIDTSVWRYEIGYIRNNELQYYTDRTENARVENGNLVLEARKDNWNGHEYTSASINTYGMRSWKYGRIEMRAKLVQGKGMWPAFWAMGESGSWPGRGELDIMEMIGGGDGYDNVTHGTVHWDDNGHKSRPGSYKIPAGYLADTFRVYGVEWDSVQIRWYLDGHYFHTVDITDPGMREFHQRFWLLLNLAVGGSWPGDPDSNTVFPQSYLVDWVRVYQPEGYSETVDPNLILNPEFNYGTDFWGSSFGSGAAGQISAVTGAGLSGTNALKLDIASLGTASWHVQVYHTTPIRIGDTLDISFMAKAAASKDISLIIQQPRSPYTEYFHKDMTVGITAAEFGPYRYISTVNDIGARLKFLAGADNTTLWLDKVEAILTPVKTATGVSYTIPGAAGAWPVVPGLQIYDITGRKVYNTRDRLPDGIYLLQDTGQVQRILIRGGRSF